MFGILVHMPEICSRSVKENLYTYIFHCYNIADHHYSVLPVTELLPLLVVTLGIECEQNKCHKIKS